MLGRKYKNYRPAAINCFYESPAAVYVLVQKNRKCLTARHRKYSMADKIKTATNLDGKRYYIMNCLSKELSLPNIRHYAQEMDLGFGRQ